MSDWRKDRDSLFQEKEAKFKDDAVKIASSLKAAKEFCASRVVPAFEELKGELEKHGREVRIAPGLIGVSLFVNYQKHLEFEYAIRVKVYPGKALPVPETRFYSKDELCTYEGILRSGPQDYTVADITKQDIIAHFLQKYRPHVHGKA